MMDDLTSEYLWMINLCLLREGIDALLQLI